MIDKVEVRDRVSCRGPTGSNHALLVLRLAVIVVLAFHHGCWAECLSSGAGPPKTGSCTRSVHKSYSTWQLLYDKLINPNLRTMFEAYTVQGKEIQVVVYPAPRAPPSVCATFDDQASEMSMHA